MNNFTTKEQSLNLVKLGLNRDTADMCYYYNFVTETNSEIPAVVVGTLHDTTSNNIPCWSVGALLELMPDIIDNRLVGYRLTIDREGKTFNVSYDSIMTKEPVILYAESNFLDAVYQMMCYLLENNLLQNNYIKIE